MNNERIWRIPKGLLISNEYTNTFQNNYLLLHSLRSI